MKTRKKIFDIDIKNYSCGWLYATINMKNNHLPQKIKNKDIYNVNISYAFPPFWSPSKYHIKNTKQMYENYYFHNSIPRFIKNLKNNKKAELLIDQEGYNIILRTIPLKKGNIILYIEDQSPSYDFFYKTIDKTKEEIKKIKNKVSDNRYYACFTCNKYEGSKYRLSKKYFIKAKILIKDLERELKKIEKCIHYGGKQIKSEEDMYFDYFHIKKYIR